MSRKEIYLIFSASLMMTITLYTQNNFKIIFHFILTLCPAVRHLNSKFPALRKIYAASAGHLAFIGRVPGTCSLIKVEKLRLQMPGI